MNNELIPNNGSAITPMDRNSAMTPMKLAAKAAAPLAVFKKAAAHPRLPKTFYATMYGSVGEPDQRELASLATGCEIMLPGMGELETELRTALETKPDKATLRMFLALLIDAHLPSAAAARSSNAEAAVEEMVLLCVDHGCGHFVVARARRILLETARFAIGGADLLAACETARRELQSALDDIAMRQKIAQIVAAPPPPPPAADQEQRRLALLRRA